MKNVRFLLCTRGLLPVRLIQSLLLQKCSGEAFSEKRGGFSEKRGGFSEKRGGFGMIVIENV